ncbi:DUF3987 domain-containing protein [Virgibacillus halodenitrificans]|uniref:DUF3987 domain-containing protein n=1 Tax=Virgibacillus halodenitrificans TaxID=1482 RepID=UPI00136FDC27|nr:DUF3987 domain-containing protein [Virgibacillus halodenitrificans]
MTEINNNTLQTNEQPILSTKSQERNWKKASVGASEELFNDILNAVKSDCTKNDIEAYKQNEWEDLVKFDKYPVPSFPVNILCGPLKSMVEHVAKSIQAPIDLAAAVVLGNLSVCLSNKFVVNPKIGWREPLNLYIVSLLDPSTRKSSVFSALTKPILKYEKEQREEMVLTIKNRKVERMALEKRQVALEREFATIITQNI